jgi:hypothetical protein
MIGASFWLTAEPSGPAMTARINTRRCFRLASLAEKLFALSSERQLLGLDPQTSGFLLETYR